MAQRVQNGVAAYEKDVGGDLYERETMRSLEVEKWNAPLLVDKGQMGCSSEP